MLSTFQHQLQQECQPNGTFGLRDIPWDSLTRKKMLVVGTRDVGKTTFLKYALFRCQHEITTASIVGVICVLHQGTGVFSQIRLQRREVNQS